MIRERRKGADRVVAEITSKGGRAITVQGDVSKATDVQRLFEETKKAFGSLDVLVNNAGVFQFEPLESITENEFHREFNTNVLGPLLTIQEAVKHFAPEGGSLINISSIASVPGLRGLGMADGRNPCGVRRLSVGLRDTVRWNCCEAPGGCWPTVGGRQSRLGGDP